MQSVEILDSSSNAVVAKHTDRVYPGILLQGDTLRIILDDIEELQEHLMAKDISSAEEISSALQKRFINLLSHYELVLEQHDLSLPYSNPVRKHP